MLNLEILITHPNLKEYSSVVVVFFILFSMHGTGVYGQLQWTVISTCFPVLRKEMKASVHLFDSLNNHP